MERLRSFAIKVAPFGRINCLASSAALQVGFAGANPFIVERTPLRSVRTLRLGLIACLAGCAGAIKHAEKPARVPHGVSQPKVVHKIVPTPDILADYRKDFEDAVHTAFNDRTATIERAYLAIDELEHHGDAFADDAESSTGDQKIDMLRKAASHYLSALKAIEIRLRLIFNLGGRFPAVMGSRPDRTSNDDAEALGRKAALIVMKLTRTAAKESNAKIDEAQRIESSINLLLNHYVNPRH